MREGSGFARALGESGQFPSVALRLVASGLTSGQIAEKLGIAQSTVEVHRRNIMRKLGLHNVAELTRYAIHSGISPAGD